MLCSSNLPPKAAPLTVHAHCLQSEFGDVPLRHQNSPRRFKKSLSVSVARFSEVVQRHCKTAQGALDKAIELGVDGWGNTLAKAHIEAAACALSLGQKEKALAHLAIVNGPLARAVPKISEDALCASPG